MKRQRESSTREAPLSELGTLPNDTLPRPSSVSPVALYSFLAPPQGKDEIGRLGGYKVRKLLGKGGMGMVFLAEDLTLCRPVALKVMKPDLEKDGQAWPRFMREARGMAAIKHDHLVTVYQVGQEGATIFLAMELLEGETLEGWIQRHEQPKLTEILRLGKEIAVGLEAMHQRGLIHRDLKPANLWVEAPTGRIKILDFGLVRDISQDGGETQLTGAGMLLGTPAFWSPEQARGKPADTRSDLFSLGCVLYRLCTRQYAFPGANTLAQLTAVATDNPTPVRRHNPRVPEALSQLVMQLLAKDPKARPQTAGEVAQRLSQIKRGMSKTVRADKVQDTEQLVAAKTKSRGRLKKTRGMPTWLKVAIIVGAVTVASIITVGMARLLAGPTSAEAPANIPTKDAPGAGVPSQVFLTELPKASTVNWPFHKMPKGEFKGPPPELYGPVTVKGKEWPHSIFMHPAPQYDSPASITYELSGKYTWFTAKVSLNDSSPFCPSPITFSVYGDGKLLWRSQPLIAQKDSQACSIGLKGVCQLKLETTAAGDVRKTHAVWLEPQIGK